MSKTSSGKSSEGELDKDTSLQKSSPVPTDSSSSADLFSSALSTPLSSLPDCQQLLPVYGFKVSLNHTFSKKWNPFFKPKLSQMVPLVPLALRYIRYYITQKLKGRRSFIDQIFMETSKQMYGVPLGGIGSGTIGRGFKGEFCRFHIIPGTVDYNSPNANQFIVSIRSADGKVIYQRVLSVSGKSKPKDELSSWNFNLDGCEGEYCGLYPRSWTVYDLKQCRVRLILRQVSPVIPNDYKDSCLPCGVFVWSAYNYSDSPLDISIAMCFRNGTGTTADKKGHCSSEVSADRSSVMLRHKQQHYHDVTYCLAVNNSEGGDNSVCGGFSPSGGEDLWTNLLTDGDLSATATDVQGPVPELAVAVCRKMKVEANSVKDFEFCLSWDMPLVTFKAREKTYKRRYTRWFKGPNASDEVCRHALKSYQEWERKIEEWQRPVLNDIELPSWFKSALFNELYYVADSGSVWIDMPEEELLSEKDPRVDYGRFCYMESHEYRMFNTYDVHFYASWALVMLWPELQKSLQYDIAEITLSEQTETRRTFWQGTLSARKVKNTVPHDVGEPEDEPYVRVNSYIVHSVEDWKDLNLKLVLQVYRDYHMFDSGSDYLSFMWSACVAVMEKSETFTDKLTGLIINSGPDQTYDSWSMHGASAYCNNLWVCSLQAMTELADTLDNQQLSGHYNQLFQKVRSSMQDKLYNGSYYNFDSCSHSSHSKVIMSDQLAGYWYLSLSKEETDTEILPSENILSCLQSIYDNNVVKFGGGTMGAVNGWCPKGNGPDPYTLQSEEMWTGVTYGVAATMIKEGMVAEGFKTAEGVYRTVYEEIGLGFETPEALMCDGHYRSLGYMRPLSIWSMLRAWQLRQQ